MNTKDFSTAILVDQTPEEAFAAINNVRGWWIDEIEGDSEKLNDEFAVRFWDIHYSKQKLAEFVPGKKIVWLVIESTLSFLSDKEEWNGTTISFDISRQGNKTEVRFTHQGLIPKIECYGACSNAWSEYIQGSLFNLITLGKGKPTQINKTENMENKNFTATILVDQTPEEVCDAITNVRG